MTTTTTEASSAFSGAETPDVPPDWIEPDAETSGASGDPGEAANENAAPSDRMTLEEFREWYAQRFFLVNMGLAPFVGGPLQSLDIQPTDASLIMASDSLYRLAEKRGWERLLRRSAGAFSLIESHLTLAYGVISGVAAEIAERRAAAQQTAAPKPAANDNGAAPDPGFTVNRD